jgi:hypothetical protein
MDYKANKDYVELIEPLITKLVAISYKMSAHIILNEDDKKKMEHIKTCALLYRELTGDKLKSNNDKVDKKLEIDKQLLADEEFAIDTAINSLDNWNDDKEVTNWFDGDIPSNWFDLDTPGLDDADATQSKEISTVPHFPENKKLQLDNKETVKEEKEISYETDEKLIELCKKNKIRFDELTMQCSIQLQNIQDSFWTTVDVQ